RLLTQNIPNILLSIHEGIALIDKFHQQAITFIKQLEVLHLNALRTNVASNQHTEDGRGSHPEMSNHPVKNSLSNTNLNDNNLADEILAETVRHEAFNFHVSSPEIQNSSYFDLVRDLPLNTWLEFKDNDGGVFSGKLTWKSNFTGDYVFMNRRYKPVADVDMCELIKMFENHSVTIINNVPLLDQAIDSVIKCLNNCVGGWKNDSPVVH
ncbi:MAG: DUF1631 family protein, partial [Thiohalomonadales bacterium]